MLTRDRYERNNDEEWPVRRDGFIGAAAGDCCILMEYDAGGGDDVLMEYAVSETDCMQLESC